MQHRRSRPCAARLDPSGARTVGTTCRSRASRVRLAIGAASFFFFFFFLMIGRPPSSTLFPYPTLFRSLRGRGKLHGPIQIGIRGLKGGPSSSPRDWKSTRLNSSHLVISYAVFCLKK